MGAQELQGNFQYNGTWRHTYIASRGLSSQETGHSSLHIQHFYSDLLYQPWHCATMPLQQEWLKRDNLERRSKLSAADFRELYEAPNKPVILTDQVNSWVHYLYGCHDCNMAAHTQVIFIPSEYEAGVGVGITLTAVLV